MNQAVRADAATPTGPSSFAAGFLEAAAAFGARTSLVDGMSGEELSYTDLARSIRVFAAALVDRGLEQGEVTAIISPNTIWYPVALYGIALAGGTFTTLNPLSAAEDVRRLLELTGATRVILTEPVYDRLREVLAGLPLKEVIAIGDAAGATSFSSMLVGRTLDRERRLDLERDALGLLFSSGTSGLPKAVKLSNRNFTSAVSQQQAGAFLEPGETVLAALPFFHIYGQVSFIGGSLTSGGRLIVMPAFEFEQVLRVVQEHRIAVAPVVAPIVLLLAKHPLVDHFDLTSLRLVISGASPISGELMRLAADRLGVPVVNAWGLTETTTNGAFSDLAMRDGAVGSVGRLMEGMEIRVVAIGTERDVSAGEDGELLLRGPNVMLGYHGDEAATAEALNGEGWLRTGDVGRIDADGNIFIVDRAKEFIKFKGFQISPAELEGVLLTHPAVADAAVVPSPDAESGEVPKAFVVRRSPVGAGELFDYVTERVSPYKRLRDIEFTDQIPKTPAGKILRRVLVLQEREKRDEARLSAGRLEDRVVVERRGAVLSIQLDRPRKMNAFDRDMFIGLARAVTLLEDDPDLHVGVIHAAGTVFSSGLDIISAAPLAARGELRLDEGLVDVLEVDPDARRRRKPLVAAVNGKCFNLGVELAAACDVVVAAEDAVFAQREVAVGLFPFGSATVNLPPKIGLGNALRYMLTAEDFSAAEAKEMGLVQQLASPEDLLERAFALAQRIASNSPTGVAAAIASVRIAREQGPLAALKLLPFEVARLTATRDFREGVLAFQERRQPVFTGQ